MKYLFKIKKGIVEVKNGDTVMVFHDELKDDALLGHVVQLLGQLTGFPGFESDLRFLVQKYARPANLVAFPTHIECAECGQLIALGTDKYTVKDHQYRHTVCPWKMESDDE